MGNRHVRRHEKILLALMIVASVFGAVFYVLGGVTGVATLVVADIVAWYGVVRERTIMP
jgi:hypothetical protein